ncbi:hypothetical protein M1N05_02660 [Dehalococcoidales bacterium]|nr:hypothetical protein [Dehalococcoidales bacterium]
MTYSVGQAGKNDKYRLPSYPNLIKGMVIRVWLSDITLTLQALKMAIARRRPTPVSTRTRGEYVE